MPVDGDQKVGLFSLTLADGTVKEFDFVPSPAAPGEAVADASGNFELQGLADTLYVVSAKLEGHEVIPVAGQETRTARPGSVVDFVVRPVVLLEARVLLPDGTEAASATVRSTRAQRQRSPRVFDWSPADPTLRLPACEHTLVATSGAKDEYASDPVAIAVRPGQDRASVTLQLVDRPGICGRVILPGGSPRPGCAPAIASWASMAWNSRTRTRSMCTGRQPA